MPGGRVPEDEATRPFRKLIAPGDLRGTNAWELDVRPVFAAIMMSEDMLCDRLRCRYVGIVGARPSVNDGVSRARSVNLSNPCPASRGFSARRCPGAPAVPGQVHGNSDPTDRASTNGTQRPGQGTPSAGSSLTHELQAWRLLRGRVEAEMRRCLRHQQDPRQALEVRAWRLSAPPDAAMPTLAIARIVDDPTFNRRVRFMQWRRGGDDHRYVLL